MGRQVGGKYVSRQVCKLKLVGRQVDRHARIYLASFGRLQMLVHINVHKNVLVQVYFNAHMNVFII